MAGAAAESWKARLIALAASFGACAGVASNLPSHPTMPADCLTGELRLVGSRSMEPLVERWVRLFRKQHPEVLVQTNLYGSGTAAGALAEGIADLAPLSRELDPQEQSLFPDDLRPEAVKVGVGSHSSQHHAPAVALFVHRDNPVRGVTIEQLRAILSGDPRYAAWSQVGPPGSVSLRCKIRIYAPAWSDELHHFLRSRILNGRPLPKGVFAEDARAAGDPCALGLGDVSELPRHARLLGVSESEGRPFVAPTAKAVAKGYYPLARSIYLYVSRGKSSPAAAEFVRIALSDRGQEQVDATPFNRLPSLQDKLIAEGRRPSSSPPGRP